MQQPGGEDMAALGIGAELDFVDREELDRPVERHRFDGADEIGRVRRQDLFFAGDQRDGARAAQLDDPVVILARQQAQRKPDHAAPVIEHPLDGEMGLAGIGRPENRDEARCRTEHGHGHKGAVPTSAGQGSRRCSGRSASFFQHHAAFGPMPGARDNLRKSWPAIFRLGCAGARCGQARFDASARSQ